MRFLLYPLAWIYQLVVAVRHKLYDCGAFGSEGFEVPLLCVGNLRVGGTGKTPMTDFLVSRLKREYRVAVLSRGYRRKTKGFVLAADYHTTAEIGDEPKLLKMLHPDVTVAVCENRAKGVRRILAADPAVNLIILDDAFQHRAVRPKVCVLLTEYGKLYKYDRMMPVGRLRDLKSRAAKADFIAVTKCDPEIRPIDLRLLYKEIDLKVYQHILFTTLDSRPPESLLDGNELPGGSPVVVVTAIAGTDKFICGLEPRYPVREKYLYRDHYRYTKNDLVQIVRRLKPEESVVCTAKDSVKILELGLEEEALGRIYVVNISVRILPYAQSLDEWEFISVLKQKINGTYRSNSQLYKP